jgi:hypothetical protein
MTTETVETAAPRSGLVIGPTYRILRVATPGMLAPYAREFTAAVRDFHARSGAWPSSGSTTPGEIEAALRAVPGSDTAALWLGLTPSYRLLGWLVATVGRDLWGPVTGFVLGAYLWPKRPNLACLPALVAAAESWARQQGATAMAFATVRDRPRAWARLGYRPAQRVYAKEWA